MATVASAAGLPDFPDLGGRPFPNGGQAPFDGVVVHRLGQGPEGEVSAGPAGTVFAQRLITGRSHLKWSLDYLERNFRSRQK
jgi:hypothetical protein